MGHIPEALRLLGLKNESTISSRHWDSDQQAEKFYPRG